MIYLIYSHFSVPSSLPIMLNNAHHLSTAACCLHLLEDCWGQNTGKDGGQFWMCLTMQTAVKVFSKPLFFSLAFRPAWQIWSGSAT